MRISLIHPSPPTGKTNINLDAVLSRCSGMISKADYVLPPMGMTSIASILIREGFEVEFIDAAVKNLSSDDIINSIRKHQPDLVITNPSTPFFRYDLQLMEKINKMEYKTAAVGTHVTVFPEDTIKTGAVDYVVRGEPEITSVELVKALEKDRSIKGLKGVSYKSGNKIIHNKGRELIDDLDSLPFLFYEMLDHKLYQIPFARGKPFLTTLTTRGCPYNCNFCTTKTYYGKSWRARSPENVVDEVEYIIKKLNVGDIGFWDDTFTIGKKRVIGICKEILERDLDFGWICLSRIDTVDKEMLEWMKKAGCYQIQYGIESGSQRILDNIRKDISIKQIKKSVSLTKEVGIEVAAFYMLGLMGETEKTIQETIKLSKELDTEYASFNILTPFPGSDYYESVKEKLDLNWEKFDAKHVSYSEIKPEILEFYLQKAFRGYYLRPKFIIKSLLRLRSASELRNKARGMLGFMRMIEV